MVECDRVRPVESERSAPRRAVPLAVLLALRVGQVVEVQEDGGVGEFAAVGRQIQQLLGGARHRADVHVPHLLRRVQLQQLLLDLQVLLYVPALVLELQDGLGVAVDGGDRGGHAGGEGAPGQTKRRETRGVSVIVSYLGRFFES